MPSRKQRRRREKGRRHEYEYVYVDDEGREVAVEDEPEPADAKKNGGKKNAAKAATKTQATAAKKRARPAREVKPPSWNRVFKRAPIFFVVIVLISGIGKNAPPIQTRITLSILYTAILIPFMYFVDSAMYRAYRKRIGDPLPPRGLRRRT